MKRILITIAVLVLVMGGCRKESDFSERFSTMFLPDNLSTEDGCGVSEQSEDIYRLHELFFKNDQVLTFKVNVFFMPNSKDTIEDEFFHKMIDDASDFFIESGAGINFQVENITQITGKPEDNPKALEFIEKIEFVSNGGEKLPTLRNSYRMSSYKLWDRIFSVPNSMNLYVIDDLTSPFAGVASGLGGTSAFLRLDFCSSQFKTLFHEFGHNFGLLHTFSTDKSNVFCSPYTGDKIEDTYKSPQLSGVITDSCMLSNHWHKLVKSEWYSSSNDPELLGKMQSEHPKELQKLIDNVMSYTGKCRISFTDGQVLRMRKTVETSKDLRNAVVGMDENSADDLWNQFKDIEVN